MGEKKWERKESKVGRKAFSWKQTIPKSFQYEIAWLTVFDKNNLQKKREIRTKQKKKKKFPSFAFGQKTMIKEKNKVMKTYFSWDQICADQEN